MRTHKRATFLVAAQADHLTLTAAATAAEADTDARSLSGMLLPYGALGRTSLGTVRVMRPGVISIPADVSRVKLTDGHGGDEDPLVRSIGYATAIRDTEDGIRGAFRVGRTPAGDTALLEASERVRDAFSVELTDVTTNERGEVVKGTLSRVALVITPAWADAREDGLAASLTTTGRNTRMNRTQRARLYALLNKGTLTAEESQEMRDLLALAEEHGVAVSSLTESGEEPEEEAEEEAEEEEAEEGSESLAASHRGTSTRRRGAARAPRSTGRQRRGRHTVADLAAAQARIFRGESAPALEAALSDITSTANLWTARDDYAGELWSGLSYVRRFVPLLQSGPLNSYKGTGWRWVVKPAVGDYAGDKAAVPSNAATTEATEWLAARLAGAHDLDRKFFDFGDQEFISSYYGALTEDYAMKSDDKARLFILSLAEATGAAGATIYHAAAQSAQAVFDATNGLTPDYILVNSADTFALLNTSAADAPDPRILEMFGVTPDRFMVAPGVPAGTVVAGSRQAGRFRELSSSPVRVEALNITNGGVDGGVFGYYATEETFVGGVQSATFVAA